jgi:hypothetical protein
MATETKAKGEAKKGLPAKIRFNVGADCGTERFEVGDVAAAGVMPKATLGAWLDQGLIEPADD